MDDAELDADEIDADAEAFDWGSPRLRAEVEVDTNLLLEDISCPTLCKAEAASAAEVKYSNWLISEKSNDFRPLVSEPLLSIIEGDGSSSLSKRNEESLLFGAFKSFISESWWLLCDLDCCEEETDRLVDKFCSDEKDILQNKIWKYSKFDNYSTKKGKRQGDMILASRLIIG